MTQTDGEPRRFSRAAFAVGCALSFFVFTALGIWQIQRRTWKLNLIAAIDARIHASAVEAPGPDAWPALNAAHDAYRRVRVEGTFADTPPARVQAVTELGPGYWVMSPFRSAQGFTVLINRGFVPQDDKDHVPAPMAQAVVTGLLRISEPGGGFLHKNDPADGRWYSRDVAAIALTMGLGETAPYFIDADASSRGAGQPAGGLTVVDLPNNHLIYVFTWFGLAAMAGIAFIRIVQRNA